VRSYLWIVPLALLWPALQLLVVRLRFPDAPLGPFVAESPVFLPMGIVGGAVLVYCWRRAPDRSGKIGALVGYLVASPFALVGALVGGLVLPPLLGTALFGGGTLAAGTFLGYAVGTARRRRISPSGRSS
jgi:hypothetical protein